MRDSIELLDNFIKDTTHEINTPISIINSNIEMLNLNEFNDKDSRKLRRIKIASRTLEGIYKDLKFTTLQNLDKIESKEFNLKELILERVEYMSLHMESKKINVELLLEDFIVLGDTLLYSRLIDNILSNAIKYNRVGGRILIELKDNIMIVEDSGIGIKKEFLDTIFFRYSRFNNSEGGFGIGLDIVKNIADHYNLTLKVESEINKWTRFIVKW